MYFFAFLTPFFFLPCISSQNSTAVCTSCGDRFPDPNDCSLYQTCQRDACGSYSLHSETCFVSSKYDPINKSCTTNPVNCTAPVLKAPDCKCGDTRLPDPTDKTKYYACILKVSSKPSATHKFCPTGLIYSDELKRCKSGIPTSTSGHGDRITENCTRKEDIPNKPIYPDSGCIAEGKYPDAFDCSIYYNCIYNPLCDQFEKLGTNCQAGYLFDPVTKLCAPAEQVKCLCNSFKVPFNCPFPGVFPDPFDNSKYYICYLLGKCDFFKKRLSCPLGLVYDKRTKLCQKEQHHSSESDSSSFESNSKNKEHRWSRNSKASDMSGKHSKDRSNERPHYTHSQELSLESDEDFKGYCIENGHLPINGKKHHYFFCIKGKLAIQKKCGDKMVFDAKSRRCISDLPSSLIENELNKGIESDVKNKNGKRTNINVNVYNIN